MHNLEKSTINDTAADWSRYKNAEGSPYTDVGDQLEFVTY